MRLNGLILLVCLAGCADIPELPGTMVADDAPYPALIPIEGLLAAAAGADAAIRVADAGTAGVMSRVAGLSARANALRGPVIDGATRARMRAGVDTSALQ